MHFWVNSPIKHLYQKLLKELCFSSTCIFSPHQHGHLHHTNLEKESTAMQEVQLIHQARKKGHVPDKKWNIHCRLFRLHCEPNWNSRKPFYFENESMGVDYYAYVWSFSQTGESFDKKCAYGVCMKCTYVCVFEKLSVSRSPQKNVMHSVSISWGTSRRGHLCLFHSHRTISTFAMALKAEWYFCIKPILY